MSQIISPSPTLKVRKEICDECGKTYYRVYQIMHYINYDMEIPLSQKICPTCRSKRAVDKTKRIIDIIKE